MTTMSQDISFIRISAEETVPLRHSVLWPDKPVSYVLLPEDSSGYHFGAVKAGSTEGFNTKHVPIAVISLFKEPLPSTSAAASSLASSTEPLAAARFRKFACHPDYQGRGIGTGLLQHVFAVAKDDLECSVVWCDARLETAGWYERRGMQKFGETFWKGPIEYIRMKIDLTE